MGYPEALVREQPYLEAPLTRRASSKGSSEEQFPGTRTRRGAGDTAGVVPLTSAVATVKSLDVAQATTNCKPV